MSGLIYACVVTLAGSYNKANLFIILGRMFASTINTFLYLLLLLHIYFLVEGLVTIYLGLRISAKFFYSIKAQKQHIASSIAIAICLAMHLNMLAT